MRKTLREDIESSPIPSTVDKFWEAWYFFLAMAGEYHDPHAFRYNLNAFVQALRNITFMLQSEERKPASFEAWYREKQDNMRSDPLLRRFVEARNLVVKQSMLSSASEARLGVFRWRKFKLGVGGEIDPFVDSRILLSKATTFCLGLYLDEGHSSIGEQAGVWRKWVVDAIGPEEIMTHCTEALEYMAFVVEEASQLWGTILDASFGVPHADSYQVLLESDLDPDLPKKWGWDKVMENVKRQKGSAESSDAPGT